MSLVDSKHNRWNSWWDHTWILRSPTCQQKYQNICAVLQNDLPLRGKYLWKLVSQALEVSDSTFQSSCRLTSWPWYIKSWHNAVFCIFPDSGTYNGDPELLSNTAGVSLLRDLSPVIVQVSQEGQYLCILLKAGLHNQNWVHWPYTGIKL